MKRAEIESFLKSFSVFFISLSILSALILYFEYAKQRQSLEQDLFNQMKLCSFDLKCTQFTFDFVPLQTKKLYELERDGKGVFALFSIPDSTVYALKLHYSDKQYDHLIQKTRKDLLQLFIVSLMILMIISALFSLYALSPLRKALRLTEEFSRDILHDFNTPLASLRLNASRLHVPQSEQVKLDRIEQSIQTMISLGDNLRSYLEGHPLQNDTFDLLPLLRERITIFQKLYPDITFILDPSNIILSSNRDAIIRIIDNLISNAAKYNIPKGSVTLIIEPTKKELLILDTGKGIKQPEKVFDRFYKEHERGLGIGLHIVKKLCDELSITIKVESVLGKGSQFLLDLRALTPR